MDIKEAIETAYNVEIGKARRGYYFRRKRGFGHFLSKDYASLELLRKALEQETDSE